MNVVDNVDLIEDAAALVLLGENLDPADIHATGATTDDALNFLNNKSETAGSVAGSFDLAPVAEWQVDTLKKGEAILAAENAPLIGDISFSLDVSEVVDGSSLSTEVSGVLANAEYVEVNDVHTAESALLLSDSASIDAYSLRHTAATPATSS